MTTDIMDEELHELLVDMAEIAKLEVSDLYSPSTGQRQKSGIVTSIIRTVKGESRHTTVKHIKNIISRCSKIMKRYLDHEYYNDIIDGLINMINKDERGLRSLLITYNKDINFTAEIEVSIKQIYHFIPEEKRKELNLK